VGGFAPIAALRRAGADTGGFAAFVLPSHHCSPVILQPNLSLLPMGNDIFSCNDHYQFYCRNVLRCWGSSCSGAHLQAVRQEADACPCLCLLKLGLGVSS